MAPGTTSQPSPESFKARTVPGGYSSDLLIVDEPQNLVHNAPNPRVLALTISRDRVLFGSSRRSVRVPKMAVRSRARPLTASAARAFIRKVGAWSASNSETRGASQ